MNDLEERRRKNREKMRAWRAANRDRVRERQRAHYAEHADEIRAAKRAYRAANPDKYRDADRARYAASPGKHAAYMREWRANNPDKNRESNRRYRAKNPEKRRASKQAWSAANPEKIREMNRRKYAKDPVHTLWLVAKYRARRYGLDFEIAESDIILPSDMACPVFGLPLAMSTDKQHDSSMSIDRIDNTKGYIPGNVRVVSWLANNLKGKATLSQLVALGDDAKRLLASQAYFSSHA